MLSPKELLAQEEKAKEANKKSSYSFWSKETPAETKSSKSDVTRVNNPVRFSEPDVASEPVKEKELGTGRKSFFGYGNSPVKEAVSVPPSLDASEKSKNRTSFFGSFMAPSTTESPKTNGKKELDSESISSEGDGSENNDNNDDNPESDKEDDEEDAADDSATFRNTMSNKLAIATPPPTVIKKVLTDNEVEGKQGWLYREIESNAHLKVAVGSKEKDNYGKIWVCLYEGYLLFSEITTASELFNNTVCAGFLKLSTSSEVKLRYTTDTSFSSTIGAGKNSKKYSFQVKENELLSITFFCETEGERDEWIAFIKQAITGNKTHYLDNKTLILPSAKLLTSNSVAYHYNTTVETPDTAIDFPRKSGFLKKTSTAKSSFALKTTNNRYFRLESGELRYYDDDSNLKSAAVKDTINLLDATMGEGGTSASNSSSKDAASLFIVLNLQNPARQMKLEATTAKIATEWRDVLAETIALLAQQRIRNETKAEQNSLNQGSGSGSASNGQQQSSTKRRSIAMSMSSKAAPAEPKQRRFNIHDQVSQDERDVATMFYNNKHRKSATSTPMHSPATAKFNSANSSAKNSPMSPARSSLLGRPSSMVMMVDSPSTPNIHIEHNNMTHNSVKSNATIELLKHGLQSHFLVKSAFLDVMPLIDSLLERSVIPGEVVLWHGATGDMFYILESGQLEVLKDGKHICFMHPGKTFGDLALLHNISRQATIRAVSQARLWCLTRNTFRSVAADEEVKLNTEKISFLRQIELFSKFSDVSLETIAEVMQLKTYKNTDKIIKQGDVGDCFYMILSGRVSVSQSTLSLTGSSSVELVKLGTGKHFGELALIDDAPRKATVTAITPVVQCWTLDRVNFLNLFGSMNDAVKESVGVAMLKQVKILATLTNKQLITISRCLVSVSFSEGETIIKQGDIGDSFYLISSGEVSIQVNHIQVAVLYPGAFFGEMSLLSNERRSATVIAIEDTVCLVLSRADFDTLLGPLDELIKAESKRRNEEIANANKKKSDSSLLINRLRSISGSFFTGSSSPAATRRKSVNKESNALFANTSSMFEVDSLEKIKKLGIGTFGTVYLVQHNATSKLYAMKVIHKCLLYNYKQENNIYNERDIILALVDCQHITALYATMQDASSVYMVLQYVPGGDLFTLLYGSQSGSQLQSTKLGGLPVAQALFYAGLVLSALTYMHDLEIVYRDLKPENMLIDSAGYIKLTDFGTAKKLAVGQKSNTLCGSPEYIAPEIILSHGHNKAVDFWAFGVFVYELLCRSTPFAHSNVAITYQLIIESEDTVLSSVTQNGQIDAASRALISGLLQNNPNMRLGMLRNGMDDLWGHAFFKNITQEQIDKRILKPPYIPEADEEDATELSHLDAIEMLEDTDDIPPYIGQYDFSSF